MLLKIKDKSDFIKNLSVNSGFSTRKERRVETKCVFKLLRVVVANSLQLETALYGQTLLRREKI